MHTPAPKLHAMQDVHCCMGAVWPSHCTVLCSTGPLHCTALHSGDSCCGAPALCRVPRIPQNPWLQALCLTCCSSPPREGAGNRSRRREEEPGEYGSSTRKAMGEAAPGLRAWGPSAAHSCQLNICAIIHMDPAVAVYLSCTQEIFCVAEFGRAAKAPEPLL